MGMATVVTISSSSMFFKNLKLYGIGNLRYSQRILCQRNFSSKYYNRPGKLSYLSVPGEKPLLGLTVGQLVDQSASKYGDADCVVVSNPSSRTTFTQLKQDCDDLAAGFLNMGLKKGDRVGIWGPNSLQWYETQMAAMKAGLILVNINPSYQARELHYCLNKVGVKCMVFAEQFKTQNYFQLLLSVLPEIEKCDPGKISSTKAPQLTHLISISDDSLKGTYTLKEVKHSGTKGESRRLLEKAEPEVQFDDICNIQFTSGTTGQPKGVMLTHHNLVNNGYQVGDRCGFTPKDKICLTVPLFHCYGNVAGALAGLHYGTTCVMPGPGFDPKASIKTVAEEKCTVIYGTPTMHIDMLNSPGFENLDLSSLRIVTTAGAICPAELIKEMKVKYTVDSVTSFYGLTETSPVFFQNLPEDSDEIRATTVGYPHNHLEVKLIDSSGKIVPVGTEGEMCVRGSVVMQGYWEDPVKTAEVVKSRWFHTGDLFVMHESGHASIVGRLKDMIIRGGENIYPKEVEEFLHTHPKIQEAQVFGIPDKRLGEDVAAWLNVKDGQSLTEEDVKAYCKGKIAHYKIPRHIHFTKEFPKTISGKIQKYKMREDTMKKLGIE